ncbi:mannitol dehydrogenase family protein [Mangrovibrevibacter kandeliae]|uniref:mannitol dehydrogenase family protein n=1 Tax=Mangrovibrevibacter kandeliae TaxID=2968473 RepID=UPI0021174943|nr:mannitol dehydrogenase family protein [Aurantimonas sp. CSK15Z-1]
MTRLGRAGLDDLPASVARPGYDPAAHAAGIVHLGCGAFHRAHQAVYTDAALARSGGDWRITAVSLRSTEIADALNPQDGLYTLVEAGPEGQRARVIGSIARVLAGSREPQAILDALAAAATRIVTITVTEKAYGIDRRAGEVDPSHPSVAADLADPRAPTGVLGLLVEGLRRRFEAGLRPFTVLCCDNLPHNGALVRMGVVGLARRIDPALAERIEREVAFPSSMVDRITPAPNDATLGAAERLTGRTDRAAVETEPFSQWVIEDRFPTGRPDWEAGGALFVEDVAPFEAMKLRMLNGAHSMLAYAGFLAGHVHVRDVMADPALAGLVRRHLSAAAATLGTLGGIDLAAYAEALLQRFSNPAIAHATYQIAMDGTEKLPQRIVAPAVDALRAGQSLRPFAFAVAAWMRYCVGRTESGERYDLRDPRKALIEMAVRSGPRDAAALTVGLLALPGLFPVELLGASRFVGDVETILAGFLRDGAAATIAAEAGRVS